MVGYRVGFFAAALLVVVGLAAAAWGVRRLGGWRYTAHRLVTEAAWPTYTQRRSQLEALPPLRPGDLVLLGDSHVAYGQWDELLPGVPVRNRGISGEGIEGLRAFAKTLNLDSSHAVVLEIGTNDLLFHEPEWLLARYDSAVAELRGRGARVWACTLPGVNGEVRWTGIDAAAVARVNAALRERAPRLVDLAAALDTERGVLPAELTDDGVHLRGEGYLRWARALRDSVGPARLPRLLSRPAAHGL